MTDFIDTETDFIRNITTDGTQLDPCEQSALNLLVEVSPTPCPDKDLFAIAIILELTVEQSLNVKSAYIALFNEDLG